MTFITHTTQPSTDMDYNMKTILTLLLLIASPLYAETLYLEVNDQIARIEITNITEAVLVLADVVSETEATNYTAHVHKHGHEEDPANNKPCEVTPLANGDDEDVVIIETELTDQESRTKLPEYLAMVYDGTAQDLRKKADKLKKSKWLKNKPVKERKEKRAKK